MRVTVVGGGVVGLLTAVEGVLAGHRVTLLEQYGLPHPGAASADHHRMLRVLHPSELALAEAAWRAHHRWVELEQLLDVRCYQRVGALSVLPAHLAGSASGLADLGAPARVLSAAELAATYPHLRFPRDTVGVLETATGVLLADQVLAACLRWLCRQPHVELRAHRRAERVVGTDVLLADGSAVPGDAVVLAAGPWSRRLLTAVDTAAELDVAGQPDVAGQFDQAGHFGPPGRPADVVAELTLWRQCMLYCAVPRRYATAWSGTPAVVSSGRPDGAWLVPPVAGTPLKISAASACRAVEDIADATTPDHWRAHLTEIAAELVDGFQSDWVVGARDCHYLGHPVAGPRLVTLGERVAGLAACGGASFKFAPLIARSLVDQVTRSLASKGGARR